MPKISIIIPVFNSINTIERCIDSLLQQSLYDIEIILIDDASTDGTTEKLIQYEKKHKRIKIIKNKSNSSASISRKLGILESTGKYIIFVDADDELKRNACEVAFNEMENRKTDMIQFGVEIKSKGATQAQIEWFDDFVNKRPQKRLNAGLSRKCFVEQQFGFTIWNKIYRSNICKIAATKITDTPIYKAQDLLLQFFILIYAVSIETINQDLYIYSYGAGVTGGSSFDREKINKHMSQSVVAKEIYNFLKSNRLLPEFKLIFENIVSGLIIDNLNTVNACKGTQFENYAKDTFTQNWGNGKLKRPENTDEQLTTIVNQCFQKLSPNDILLTLDERISNESRDRQTNQQLEKLKGSLKQKNAGNIIPIVMAVNLNYAPYLAVAVESIRLHNKSDIFLYIFYTDLPSATIERIKALSAPNLQIEFIDVGLYIESDALYSRAHYSVEMYYRLIIPEIFSFLPKVLYLDCDIVVNCDLRELFNIELDNNILAAARNPVHKWMAEYLAKNLNFNYKKYFNSGVLLINTKEFTKNDIKEKCLTYLNNNSELACPDQDALNITCLGRIKYIPQKWNFQWHHAINADNPAKENSNLLADEAEEYSKAIENIKILHFTSNVKPWNSPSISLSKKFWEHAIKSPFFFDILNVNIGLKKS
jgi:lipopolysaccharide biosynthesis glycosyltransferase/glycosyltransferase involved in cell wall biosynthesis